MESSKTMLLRIAALELEFDLGFEVVLGVLRFPVAEGHAQLVEQRAIDVAPFFGFGFDFVLGDEHEIVLLRPALEQVLEGFANNALALCARDFLQRRELVEVLLDQELAHGLSMCPRFLLRANLRRASSATGVVR